MWAYVAAYTSTTSVLSAMRDRAKSCFLYLSLLRIVIFSPQISSAICMVGLSLFSSLGQSRTNKSRGKIKGSPQSKSVLYIIREPIGFFFFPLSLFLFCPFARSAFLSPLSLLLPHSYFYDENKTLFGGCKAVRQERRNICFVV